MEVQSTASEHTVMKLEGEVLFWRHCCDQLFPWNCTILVHRQQTLGSSGLEAIVKGSWFTLSSPDLAQTSVWVFDPIKPHGDYQTWTTGGKQEPWRHSELVWKWDHCDAIIKLLKWDHSDVIIKWGHCDVFSIDGEASCLSLACAAMRKAWRTNKHIP